MQRTIGVQQTTGWRWGDLLLGAIFTVLLSLLAVVVLAPAPPPETAHSQVSKSAETAFNIADPCHGQSAHITQMIMIAEDTHALRPDVVDVVYTCQDDTTKRAFLWEPPDTL